MKKFLYGVLAILGISGGYYGVQKALTPKTYDFVILGDGYKGNDAKLFDQDVDSAKVAIMSTAPFAGRTDIKFYAKISKQNLGCNDNIGFGEAVQCDVSKVLSAAKAITPSVDNIIVLGNGKGHGGSDGAMIEFVGLGNHGQSIYCTFYQAAFYGKMMHEIGHTLWSINHLEGTKMGSCTNGCCEIWNKPFSAEQQTIITNNINKVTQ